MLQREWAYFFDLDGTLLEIAATPSTVVVHEDIPNLIKSLHSLTGGAVSFLTGRALDNVDQILPMDGVSVAGEHGFEVRKSSGAMLPSSVLPGNIDSVREQLEEVASRHPGLLPEVKRNSIALHYRAAPRLASYAHRLMRNLAAEHAPGYIVQKGKRVVELRPAAGNKGIALRRLMGTHPFMGRLPVFVGDDVTDEVAFQEVNRMQGHSVKVGSGKTEARWRLRDVTAVRRWLRSGIDAALAADAKR